MFCVPLLSSYSKKLELRNNLALFYFSFSIMVKIIVFTSSKLYKILCYIPGGGSGFIGKHLRDLLKARGCGVTVISRVADERNNKISWVGNKESIVVDCFSLSKLMFTLFISTYYGNVYIGNERVDI